LKSDNNKIDWLIKKYWEKFDEKRKDKN
jgi:hypothetical protein